MTREKTITSRKPIFKEAFMSTGLCALTLAGAESGRLAEIVEYFEVVIEIDREYFCKKMIEKIKEMYKDLFGEQVV